MALLSVARPRPPAGVGGPQPFDAFTERWSTRDARLATAWAASKTALIFTTLNDRNAVSGAPGAI
jgi:hypothetical protein